jgi:Uma2 family endonuclease
MIVREPAIAYGKQKYSVAEYLELEDAATEKHEYYKGELFAMSGAKMPHNHITSNLVGSLGRELSGKPCKPFGSDTRVHIEENTLFTYPDVTVVCGKVITLNDDDYNVLNPTIIFEVLSPSTKHYDSGEKFKLYQDIPTLREYVMIDSESVNVAVWRISEEGKWVLTEHKKNSETLLLHSIDVSLTIAEIYTDVSFT